MKVYRDSHRSRFRTLFEFEPNPPRPQDLTAQKIVERMNGIFIGDKVKFNSMKECYTASQVGRHSSTIPAVGTVLEHCGGYLMLKLRNGIIESCNYYDILSVNGKAWPYSIKRSDSISVDVDN